MHAGRLRAASREIGGLIGQLTAISEEGRNPLGRGAPFTPLEGPAGEQFLAHLARGVELAGEVGSLAGPSPEDGQVQGPAATRAALRARLNLWEEALLDLEPGRLQDRYGELPLPVAERLTFLHSELAGVLEELRAVLA